MTPKQLREIALHIAMDMREASGYTTLDLVCNSEAFAKALFAEFQKLQAEQGPVAIVAELYPQTREEVIGKGHAIGAYLYAAPPDLTKRIAELEAGFTKELDVVSVRNYELRMENAELAAQNAQLREALTTIRHSMKQAKIHGNDKLREIYLSEMVAVNHLALPNLSADWLRKHDAQILRNVADQLKHTPSFYLLARMAAELEAEK